MRCRRIAGVVLVALAGGAAGGLSRRALGEGDPSPEALPAARFLAPRGADDRAKALARFGGDAASEKAVDAGLDWLARHADPAGGWDADGFPSRCERGAAACDGVGKGQHGEEGPCPFDDAISALSAMAFLGRGHVPGAEGDAYGELLERSLSRIERMADPWALALSAQALCEAEHVEGKGRWLKAARAGAERLLRSRQEDGGWAYAAGFREGSDVPYAGLVVQALVAARDVGVAWPEGLGAGVDRWLDSLEADEGRLAYLADGRKYGYTPTAANAHTAAAIRALLETGTAGKRHKAHLALVAREAPVWQISFKELEVPGRGKLRVQIGTLSLYQWWYGTLAEFQAGGDGWSAWSSHARAALVGHQRPSGCARGSWDPVGTYERDTGGRVFATALAVLILEEPYRHLRLGK